MTMMTGDMFGESWFCEEEEEVFVPLWADGCSLNIHYI
jgi:hypothetical protein